LLFGVIAPAQSPARLALLALVLSFGLYVMFYNPLWRRWNPASVLLGHMIFGLWLTRMPAYYRRLAAQSAGDPDPEPADPPRQDPPPPEPPENDPPSPTPPVQDPPEES
jgi:hypothetical protein